MEKIYLKRISERLNEKELKNVLGGIVLYDEDLYSLKCHNGSTSCWVPYCPGSRSDAEATCNSSTCGGNWGSTISCAGHSFL
jgi:bacteriocin-like protein